MKIGNNSCLEVDRKGPDTESMFSELYDDDKMKAIEVQDAFDLAYRCLIPAAIGRAIPKNREGRGRHIFRRGRIRYVDGNHERGQGI